MYVPFLDETTSTAPGVFLAIARVSGPSVRAEQAKQLPWSGSSFPL